MSTRTRLHATCAVLLLLTITTHASANVCNRDVFYVIPELLNCTSVTGLLSVNNTNLTNLTGLSLVKSVGSLVIRDNPNLLSLQGLDALENVEFTIEIKNNPQLESISALANVTSESQYLTISSNLKLTSLDGLHSLRGVQEKLQIKNNPQLGSLAALRNVTGLTAVAASTAITIEQNPSLISLDGLQGLTQTSKLEISKNANLQSLDGLNSLNTVDYDLLITQNPQLVDVEALRNVVGVLAGGLDILENSALTSLDGLNGITETKTLEIRNNTDLRSLNGLSSLTSVKERIQIQQNPQLVTLEGLGNVSLDPVGNPFTYLTIQENSELESLDGLQSITSAYTITIDQNPSLISLSGLQFISSVSTLSISENPNLLTVSALSGITDIPQLAISGCPRLSSLDGLHNVASISMSLEIANTGIQSLAELLPGAAQPFMQLKIVSNRNLTSLDGLEGLTDTKFLEITGNPVLENIAGLRNVQKIGQGIWIGGPGDGAPYENQLLWGICELCHVQVTELDPTSFIHNYRDGSDFVGVGAFANWTSAGRPCASGLNCSANMSVSPSHTPTRTPSPSGVSSSISPSRTPSPSGVSKSISPTPSRTPLPSSIRCQVNCSLNMTELSQELDAAGIDPGRLLLLAEALQRASSQLDLADQAVLRLFNRLGDAVGRSFGGASSRTLSSSMASATIVMDIAGAVVNRTVISSFISGLDGASRRLVDEIDPEILTMATGNGTNLLGKLSRRATDAQQGIQLVESSEALAFLHAKSGVTELVVAEGIVIGGKQSTMDLLANNDPHLLGAAAVTLPSDAALTSLVGTYTLAPILWSDDSFPGNSLQNISASTVLTVSLLSADGSRITVEDLQSPIRLVVPLTNLSRLQDFSCASYDHGAGAWTTEGCLLDLESSTDTEAVCLCTHLTDFSVLITTDGSQSSSGDNSFPTGAIVGIAIGGGAVVCACILVGCVLATVSFILYRRRATPVILGASDSPDQDRFF